MLKLAMTGMTFARQNVKRVPLSKIERIPVMQDGRKIMVTTAQKLLAVHLDELGLHPSFEYQFLKDRKWRFDIVARVRRGIDYDDLAFEVNGGQWTGGHRGAFWGKKYAAKRKARGMVGTPQEEENNKLNTATAMGWKVFQFTNEEIEDGRAKRFLMENL